MLPLNFHFLLTLSDLEVINLFVFELLRLSTILDSCTFDYLYVIVYVWQFFLIESQFKDAYRQRKSGLYRVYQSVHWKARKIPAVFDIILIDFFIIFLSLLFFFLVSILFFYKPFQSVLCIESKQNPRNVWLYYLT